MRSVHVQAPSPEMETQHVPVYLLTYTILSVHSSFKIADFGGVNLFGKSKT